MMENSPAMILTHGSEVKQELPEANGIPTLNKLSAQPRLAELLPLSSGVSLRQKSVGAATAYSHDTSTGTHLDSII